MEAFVSQDCTMEVVMKNIYTSCDSENTNAVHVSKLIDFITPYMMEDLSALENLRKLLDPENADICVTSEKFYEAMNEWIQQISSFSTQEDSIFNKTPSCSVLEVIDEGQLPYIQSTPRASFGQKILNCEGLLNLSNVSAYSLSSSTYGKDNMGQEKTILEEELKRLEHHLNKVSSELVIAKLQLTATEEQNDILQSDLDRCKTRLHSEQQIIEHLQLDKKYSDELRDELNANKKQIEELNKKISQYEKDNHHLLSVIKGTEDENAKLEEKCEELSRREQEAKKEIIDIKTELDLKDQEITMVIKVNDELRSRLGQQRDIIDQLTNENELLQHEKNNLEKALRCDLSSRRESLVHKYKTFLVDSAGSASIGTIPVYTKQSISSNSCNVVEQQPPQPSTVDSPILPLPRKRSLLETAVRNSSTPKIQTPAIDSPLTPMFDHSLPLDLQNCHNPSLTYSVKSSQSLPTLYYIERSNVVQDQSFEEECDFQDQIADFQSSVQDSLFVEMSKAQEEQHAVTYNGSLISFEKNERLMQLEEADNFKEIVDIYKEEINQVMTIKNSIQARLESVTKENKKYAEQVEELKNKMHILEKDLNNVLNDRKEKQVNLERLEIEKTEIEAEVKMLSQNVLELVDQNSDFSAEKEKSLNCSLEFKCKVISELEQNLSELKRQFKSLQIENIAKEREISSKFNFETAYKRIQIELNEKTEEVETLTRSNDEQKQLLQKLTIANQELEQSVKQAKSNLKDHEKKVHEMMSLNENIELTASQVQVHLNQKNDMIKELVDLNKRFESNIAKLQEDLQSKIDEITELQDSVKTDMEIKNKMWRDNKELKSKLDTEVEANVKLCNKMKEMEEKHQNDYSELLESYNKEIENSCKLCDQFSALKDDLSSTTNKYNEEVNKNLKLYAQVSALKMDIDIIRESQEEYKKEINKKLTDYEDLINGLQSKLQEANSEKEKLNAALTVVEQKKTTWLTDSDVSLNENTRSRNFEKQKLSINRLKEKLENAEEMLQHERNRCEILEQSLKSKSDMEEKYTKTKLDFEQMQRAFILEKQELQKMIDDLSHRITLQREHCVGLENRLKETEGTLSLKLSETEAQNQHLLTELRNNEFIIQNAFLEIKTYKSLFQNADQKAKELSKTVSVCLFESNNKDKQIQYLNKELANRDNKILILTTKIAEQDIEMKSNLNELADKKNVIASIEKENKTLQEMLSKSDDYKEKELKDVEQKLKQSQRLLQCTEMELSLVQKKLSDSDGEYQAVTNSISNNEKIITNGRTELSRASDLVFSKWGELLEQEDLHKQLKLLAEMESTEKINEISALEHRIKIVVLLLEFLTARATIPMEGSDEGINSLLTKKDYANQYCQSDVKMIKKFTLRPSRLITTRPISPDSPSLDGESPCAKVEGTTTITEEINFNTSKDIYISHSPDNHICQACPYSDDSYDTAQDEFSFIKDGTEFTSFQDSFPNVSDTFLEKLGIHESSSIQDLTNEEIEERFATLAIQIALDSTDVKERLEKQNDRCVQQHEKFLSIIRDVSRRLRDHRCIGATDPISPVFVLLEDMKFLLKDLVQSSQQFGILVCENRMTRCWSLVTNYMASLKQDVTKMNEPSAELKENEEDSQTDEVTIKRPKQLQKRDKDEEINLNSSVLSSENKSVRGRCYRVFKNSIILTCFLAVSVLILFISVHWQCRMATNDNQVCVLDDFIKQIQIGDPPY